MMYQLKQPNQSFFLTLCSLQTVQHHKQVPLVPPGGLNGVSGAPHPRWPPYIVYVVKTARVRSVELKQLSTKFFLHYISDITHCAMTERKMKKNLLFFFFFFFTYYSSLVAFTTCLTQTLALCTMNKYENIHFYLCRCIEDSYSCHSAKFSSTGFKNRAPVTFVRSTI